VVCRGTERGERHDDSEGDFGLEVLLKSVTYKEKLTNCQRKSDERKSPGEAPRSDALWKSRANQRS